MTKPSNKWRFAIGTTSRVPDSGGLHYVIADFDDKLPSMELIDKLGIRNALIQATKHGWHMYTDRIVPFKPLIKMLEMLGADQAWIDIGKERGYFFLADKSRICFPWPVEHMVIHHGKEKARNSKAS